MPASLYASVAERKRTRDPVWQMRRDRRRWGPWIITAGVASGFKGRARLVRREEEKATPRSTFSCRKTMQAAGLWWLPLALALAASAAVGVDSQSTDTLGFISIDCGIPGGSTYIDPQTNISYVSDSLFIDTGINRDISGAYVTPSMALRYLNVRSFPNGTRNCYTIKSVTPGMKYLIRASFFYGNYDGLESKSLLFELHLGVNLWKTVNLTDPSAVFRTDVITVASADFFSVCLVNDGAGTPFISGLDVRPLKEILYPAANASRSLILLKRLNMGPTDSFIRYPDDPHDRIWDPFNNIPFWAEVSTNATVQNIIDDQFEAPSAVMKTAVVPVNSTKMMMGWEPQPGDVNEYYAVMYFSEFLVLTGNMSRQFWVYLNGAPWYAKPFTPEYLYSDAIYTTNPTTGYLHYNITVQALANSTLPPIINAMEVFSRMSDANVPSDAGDVDAMMEIKAWYKIKKNWMGDPCSPQDLAWNGVNCIFNISDPMRITTLNLSSSGLNGEITTAFARLTAIQYLDLSYNNLTGEIPAILAELPSLEFLDLTSNSLNGSVPPPLLTKSQNGILTLRTGSNPLLCANETSCQLSSTASATTKKKISIPVIVILCVIPPLVLLLLVFCFCIFRKPRGRGNSVEPQNAHLRKQAQHHDDSLQLENRQFTYLELKNITNDFKIILGKGGFGIVYHGRLEDGIEVAIKMRSQSSSQGTKEFLAEAQHLTRVHHKNLVSLVGYCKDEEYLALVYEYMAQGTLQDHLRGTAAPNGRALSWGRRLQIAVDAAQGLEYLHKGCKPALIHRDVKTGNILLSERFEAKIADFGLSKAFQSEVNTHISTAVVGTPGYLDPEYYTSYQLSEKSDVFSFGVVLLELVTGQPPAVASAGNVHIVQWVRQRLGRGNIEDVVDARLQGRYDVNSVWKCVDLALKCTAHNSHQRPAMEEVVAQLRECMELERPAGGGLEKMVTPSGNLKTEVSNVSQSSDLGMEHLTRLSAFGGPSTR